MGSLHAEGDLVCPQRVEQNTRACMQNPFACHTPSGREERHLHRAHGAQAPPGSAGENLAFFPKIDQKMRLFARPFPFTLFRVRALAQSDMTLICIQTLAWC